MKKLALAISINSALAAMAGLQPGTVLAQAQGAASAQSTQNQGAVEEVVVTGIRYSLAKSADIKRSADVISDAIAAEDIGKFPQQNIAESLQRITGVQITRSKGEGQSVSVRGLDPKFTQVLYNGRELPAASGSRSFDFTILSADFISALQVYKTPTAELHEGGIAATVNVQTADPLAVGQRRAALTVEGIHESNPNSVEPHVSAFYTDTFADNTFGVAFGADYSKRDLQVERFEAFGFETGVEANRSPQLDYNVDGDFNDTFRFNHAANYGMDLGERERKSLMAVFQYRPSEAFEARADLLYSDFDSDAAFPVNSHRFTNNLGPVVASVADANGNLAFLDSDGVDHRNNARTGQQYDELRALGLGGTYSLDDWTFDGEVSYGKSTRRITSLSLEVIGRAAAAYDFRSDSEGIPSLAYQRSFDPLDPHNYRAIGFNGQVDEPTEDQTRDARFDVKHSMDGWLNGIAFGASWGRREHSTDSNFLQASAQDLANLLGVPFDPTIEGGSFDGAQWMREFGGSGFLSGYGGSSTFPATWLSADPNAFMKDVPLAEMLRLFPPVRNTGAVSDVQEDVTAAYFRGNFGTDGGRFSGNVGVRYVRTEQETFGYIPDFNQIVFDQGGAVTFVPDAAPSTIERSYNNWLPSLNLRYAFRDDLVARFAAARVLSRPDLAVITPTTSINANVRTINSGNPGVDPYLADQYDVSLEWYFNSESLLSLAVFYKDVKNFIVSTTSTETHTVELANGGGSTDIEFTRFQPGNGASTTLRGVEIGYQQPFTFLPAPFDGFGMLANYTYIDAGEISAVAGGPSQPLPGVSKNSYNVTAYFEKPRFSTYLAYNYRSGFVYDQSSYFGDGEFGKKYAQLDLSASYNFNDSFVLTMAITNLTDEPLIRVDRFGFSRGYELNGRRTTLGLRYKF
ncbi:MAG TPA: TonB-dependent receptor [Steroidobacteraceae bacterium]|nr:TonB-dependent receptor [Steroidobacteraceae bacterium]